jgi:HD superfamily phosphohydrolase
MGSATPGLDQLQESVNTWVKEQLKGYTPRPVDGNKILREPVWGMTVLYPLEVAILDSPIVQRLRRIHQTGLVFLTFPSALHTRFDHSLGMMHCATRMTQAINQRYSSVGKREYFSPMQIEEIRLASILHDVGHACLSHLTEVYFSDYSPLKRSIGELDRIKNVRPNNHELLSSLIVRSPEFIHFVDRCMRIAHHGEVRKAEDTCKNIADMIIGAPVNGDLSESYVSEIVNGAFDADKLDYIFRDSYFTGITLGTDVDKFIFGLSIDKIPSSGRQGIVLDISATSAYDQLVLSKVSLYTNVYNHQKVLATNTLIDQILRILKDNPSIRINGVSMENPVDFLSLTDWDLLTGKSKNKEIGIFQKKLQHRDLPVRLFRISRKTVNTPNLPTKLMTISEDINAKDILRRSICREIGAQPTGCETIQIVLPLGKKLSETTDAYCRDFDREIISFNKVSPLQWVDTYQLNKWTGYVFGPYKYANENAYGKIKNQLEVDLEVTFNSKSAPKYYNHEGGNDDPFGE